MVCPKCGFEQDATRECVKCGVLFGKVHESLRPMPPVSGVPAIPMQKSEDPEPGLFAMLKDRLLPFEEKVTPFIFGGRVLVYILLLIVENSHPVTVHYVFGTGHTRLIWLIIVCGLLGWCWGIATSVLIRRRTRRRP